jgi:hypothetical protein
MVVAEASLAEGWPARTVRSETQSVEAGPVPGEGALGGDRWFLVWNRDMLGECCCWRGTVRTGDGTGARGSCQRPGKHPWVTRADGELYGFPHGAADALEYLDLADRFGPPGGARQLAVVLEDLLVVDLDGPRAVRDFARMAASVPADRLIGISTTPRGYHVWLDVPGWDQKALNAWMAQWLAPLGGWDPTSEAKAGRRGFLVDVRTGVNRYVVWPGEHPDRRWISRGEFWAREMAPIRSALLPSRLVSWDAGDRAPWAVDTGPAGIAGWIDDHRGGTEIDLGGMTLDGSDGELEATWAELERWLARLESMGAGQGRNNALNQVAYYSGSKAVAAGHSLETVRSRIIEVGESVGTHGVAATVGSGLSSGLATLKKQQG